MKPQSYEINVDTLKSISHSSMEFSQNNLNISELIFNITEDEKALPLNDTDKIIVYFKKPDKTVVFQDKEIEILDKAKGKIKVLLTTQTLVKAGDVQGEISIERVEDGTKKRANTYGFSFKVRSSIASNESIESTNEFQVFDKILKIGEKFEDFEEEDFEGIIEAGAKAETALVKATENTNQIGILSEKTAPISTAKGFKDGKSIEFEKGSRIHLKTDERWIMSQGHLSDLIRLQWITRQDGAGSKPALVWCDDDLNDKTAIISHDLANNPASLPHKHISIETTMSPTGANPGELFTRMEWPYDEDVCEIQTQSSNFTVNGGVSRIAHENGANKELRFCRSASKSVDGNFDPATMKPYYNKVYQGRWGIRSDNTAETGGNQGSDFRIVRYDDNGVALDAPVFIKRGTGNVGIGELNPQSKLDVKGYIRGNGKLLEEKYIKNSQGVGAPTIVPTQIGQIYVDTTNKQAYIAVGLDVQWWKQITV
ncbi:BppU family phage baseplate upper protein [Bacillus paranthracis]|uniref:BppU family phage baseplate upper protein n=1 Tax=Bacillus paranthracis TaxID=2026186 RepID=UPI003D1A09E7